TLYAGYTPTTGAYGSVTLPTITKTGNTCKWQNTNDTSVYYNSGASITPTTTLVLQGVCTANTQTITLNNNGGVGGSTSTTATFGANTLESITTPTKASTTNTRTVSGFTLASSATGATVSSTTALNSTSTTTYTFNGWHASDDQTSSLIASSASTPVLQANTIYTDATGKWTSMNSNVTLYAGYTPSTSAFSTVTLPTITKKDATCGWSSNSSDTTYTYNSGATITPSSNLVLYGICKANSDKPDDPTPDDPDSGSDGESTSKNYPIENSEQTLGDGEGLIIETSGEAEKITSVEIDGESIPENKYKVTVDSETGKTIITIDHDLAVGLEDGEHTITINYEDGTSEGLITKSGNKFIIENVEIEVPDTSGVTPDTGAATKNNEGIIANAPFIIIATILLSSTAAVIAKRNSKKVSFIKR
ncbi:hypothetical protein IKF92_01360, partial [Candidatus Saccharibacteria bacterium]|nr:hypothetical protein [Candidatus Saccharibacteria bacterium]